MNMNPFNRIRNSLPEVLLTQCSRLQQTFHDGGSNLVKVRDLIKPNFNTFKKNQPDAVAIVAQQI